MEKRFDGMSDSFERMINATFVVTIQIANEKVKHEICNGQLEALSDLNISNSEKIRIVTDLKNGISEGLDEVIKEFSNSEGE